MPSELTQNPQPLNRPGCLAAFAWLLALVGVSWILAGIAIYMLAEPSFTRRPDEAMGTLIFVLLIFIVACAPIFIAWGLWRQKRWSRVGVILLLSISALLTPFFFYWFREVFIELSGDNYLIPLILSSALGVILNLFILRWFARHREYFHR